MTSVIPKFPRTTWVVLGADAISALGNGLIMPFLVIYLRDARGFQIEHVGLVLSTTAVVGLAVAPATGWLIDRIGARLALMSALSLAAASALAAVLVDEVWEAFVWAGFFGAALSGMWPAAHSFMAAIVPPDQRAAVYSVHFALLNAGIGLGALVGGFLVVANRPETFISVFVLDALTFAVYVVVLARTRPRSAAVRPAEPERVTNGWRRVFRDRAFMRICALSTVLITIGYAQLSSSLPAFATSDGELSARALGLTFAVNTAVIVALQLLVLSRLAGRRRSSALFLVGILWSITWLIVLGGGSVGGGVAAVLLFAAANALFAFGETFMQATLPALVNDLAPEDVRGRYNAAYSLTWSIGNMIGPALGGFFLGAERATELFVLLSVGCAMAALYALRLHALLPTAVARFARSEQEEVASSLPSPVPSR